jgi:folate-dependent phosphoribosylglycinamide formyltransferase PurN
MYLTIAEIHKRTVQKNWLTENEVKLLLKSYSSNQFDVRLLNELLYHLSMTEILHLIRPFTYFNSITTFSDVQPDIPSYSPSDSINLCLIGTNLFHFIIPYFTLKKKCNIKVVWVRHGEVGHISKLVNHISRFILNAEVYSKSEATPDKLIHLKDYIAFHKLNFIIPKTIIDCFPKGIINDHWGTLPFYRGRSTSDYQTIFQHPVSITNHLITRGIDTGDIICYTRFGRMSWWTKYIALFYRIYKASSILNAGLDLIPNDTSRGVDFYKMHPLLTKLLRHSENERLE